MTVKEVIEDLQSLMDKGKGDLPLTIYCVNCDCSDKYHGAVGDGTGIQITVNADV